MKKIVYIFMIGLCFVACSKNKTVPNSGETSSVQFVDDAGRTVEVPSNITRVIPSGALAQMFLAAIAPDLLCANAGRYLPQQAEFVPSFILDLPEVGQIFGSRDFNFEEAATLTPDIIIDVGDSKKNIADDMNGITEKTAIQAVHISATLQTTPQAFRTLGKLLGREEKGEALAVFCEKTLSNAQQITSKSGNKTSLLYCMGKSGMNVLAKGSFHSEVIDMMSDNKAVVDNPASRGSGNETNPEQISLWNPDVILFAPDSIFETVATLPEWKNLNAIKNNHYYKVPALPYNWMGSPPSINRYLGMLWMGSVLYPQFANYDLFTEVAEYYKLFYGYTLSKEKFDEITANAL